MARLASLLFLALTLVASAAAGPALRNGPPVVVDLSKVFKTRPANWRLGGPDNEAGPLAGLGIQCNIAYRGGSVMLGTVNTYLIFYGDSWSQDTTGQNVLINLAQSIGGSKWYNIQTTYYQQLSGSTPEYVSNSVAYKGSIKLSDSTFGKSLTDQSIQDIVFYALDKSLLPVDASGVYFVLTAADIKETGGFCSSFCGWHTVNSYNGVKIKFSFVGNPATQCPSGCSGQTKSITGSFGADAMASVLAHELAEAVSDPELNAWYDCSGEENADKCAWTFGSTYTTSSGAVANMKLGTYDYLIQQNWVYSKKIRGSGCALSH